MLKVGLTGGIGCGKSIAVDAFRAFGVPIIDADLISKGVVKAGTKALDEIKAAFGAEVILKSHELNRSHLKSIIFSEPSALAKLEAIVHPRIKVAIEDALSKIKTDSYVIVDIPLLVEKNYQTMFDRIIVIDCLQEQQLARVKSRDNMAESDILKIIKTQASREERLSYATDIIDNSTDVDTLHTQIKSLHFSLIKRSKL